MNKQVMKKCPFCGGQAKQQWISQTMAIPNITKGGYAVVCQSCYCVQLSGAKTEDEAIEKWENRFEEN